MIDPELVESYEDFIESIGRRYRDNKVEFRKSHSGDFEYALFFYTKTNNLIVGIYDFKKDAGKVFDRRAKERE